MGMKIILDYLAELSANNNREWYHEHKRERNEAVERFEQLVQELIDGIGTFDRSVLHNVPKELTFKIQSRQIAVQSHIQSSHIVNG